MNFVLYCRLTQRNINEFGYCFLSINNLYIDLFFTKCTYEIRIHMDSSIFRSYGDKMPPLKMFFDASTWSAAESNNLSSQR